MTHEYSILAPNEMSALLRVDLYFLNLRVRRGIKKWKWKVAPEAKPYEGKAKMYRGHWRAYGRISYSK